jgi:hypothetical protein
VDVGSVGFSEVCAVSIFRVEMSALDGGEVGNAVHNITAQRPKKIINIKSYILYHFLRNIWKYM